MQKKYVKMLYFSPIGTLSLVADEQYLYGIWVQEQKHFERGLGDETIEAVVSHPILDPVITCLDAYFKGKSQDLSNLPLASIGTDFEKRVWSYLQEIHGDGHENRRHRRNQRLQRAAQQRLKAWPRR